MLGIVFCSGVLFGGFVGTLLCLLLMDFGDKYIQRLNIETESSTEDEYEHHFAAWLKANAHLLKEKKA